MTLPSFPTRLNCHRAAIHATGVARRFGIEYALRGMDLDVPEGAVCVLVGPNGAGKSTLMKVLLDLVRPELGEVRVLGMDPAAEAPRVRAHVGYVPEVVETAYDWLLVAGFLKHRAAFFNTWDPSYAAELCRRLRVPLNSRVRDLSKGAARRMALVTALAHRPPVLLLDEPTDGLDPLGREELMELLVEHMTAAPTTVLWSTHHVQEAERMADHVAVVDRGRAVLQASRDELWRTLRRYRARVPDGWMDAPGLNGSVLRRNRAGSEIDWTVWGDELGVAALLTASGAEIRESAPLSLDDAALTLLRATEAA